MCIPDDLREVWTSSLNGIYFPNYTNQVLAIIKTGVTKTHRVQEECPPRVFIYSYSIIYSVQPSVRLALHGQDKVPNSQTLDLGVCGSPEGPQISLNSPGNWNCA